MLLQTLSILAAPFGAKVGVKQKEDRNKLHQLHIQQAAIYLCTNHSRTGKKGKSPETLQWVHYSEAISVTLHFMVDPAHFNRRK